MSSSGRGRQRMRFDRYDTPAWCVRALASGLAELGLPPVGFRGDLGRLVEPFAGTGAILKALPGLHPFLAVEKAPECAAALRELVAYRPGSEVVIGDAFTELPSKLAREDEIVTNPPFELSESAVILCRRACRATLLLRGGFLQAQERTKWLRANFPNVVMILPKRPVFTWPCDRSGRETDCPMQYAAGTMERCACGGKPRPGNDSAFYIWAIWDRMLTGSRLHLIDLDACA